MNRVSVHALIVREYAFGEFDKMMTVITPEYGKMTVVGKGVKSLRNKNMVSCQPYAYSRMTLRKTAKNYYVEETELIDCFFGLRGDADKLSLAAYFGDVAADLTMENMPDNEIMRLTLNAFYAIANLDYQLKKIKAAYEFKAACIAGYTPDLSECAVCGKESHKIMYLDVMNGRLLCGDCKPTAEKLEEMSESGTARLYYILSEGTLAAMRYLSTCEISRFLSFEIDEESIYLLSQYAEGYLINHLEHGFPTLDFYKEFIL